MGGDTQSVESVCLRGISCYSPRRLLKGAPNATSVVELQVSLTALKWANVLPFGAIQLGESLKRTQGVNPEKT
jgi:hypothetical protein